MITALKGANLMINRQAALIFIPEEKLMLASDGPPCEAGFDRFPISV